MEIDSDFSDLIYVSKKNVLHFPPLVGEINTFNDEKSVFHMQYIISTHMYTYTPTDRTRYAML